MATQDKLIDFLKLKLGYLPPDRQSEIINTAVNLASEMYWAGYDKGRVDGYDYGYTDGKTGVYRP